MSLCRRVLFFVKRKAVEYCEQLLNVKYTTVLPEGIIEQLKKKNEVLQVFQPLASEEKRKRSKAKPRVSSRASLPRFRPGALADDWSASREVIAKSSRERERPPIHAQ
jgi:predicted unusual protein kinase regulating ubiquinone biosynthesis (AarF/ABC1/UbiB family)